MTYNITDVDEGIQPKTCYRCGHSWFPRGLGDPKRCAKCKSPYWETPRLGKIQEPDDPAVRQPVKPRPTMPPQRVAEPEPEPEHEPEPVRAESRDADHGGIPQGAPDDPDQVDPETAQPLDPDPVRAGAAVYEYSHLDIPAGWESAYDAARKLGIHERILLQKRIEKSYRKFFKQLPSKAWVVSSDWITSLLDQKE